MVIDILLGYLIVYRCLYCVMTDEGCKSKTDPDDCNDTDAALCEYEDIASYCCNMCKRYKIDKPQPGKTIIIIIIIVIIICRL